MLDNLRKSLKNNNLSPPRKFGPELRHRLPQLLLVLALMLAAFAYGGLSLHYELFPYPLIADGIKTLQTLRELRFTRKDDGLFVRFADVPPERVASNRFEFVAGDALSGPVLWQGGRYQFLEYCPDGGCLAVEFTATGQVAHAYPFRNDELEQAANAAQSDEFPYELSPAFSFTKDFYVKAMSRYANGDLLVVFYQDAAFPYSAGIARIDRAGHPVWFRRDYSHHWPHIEEDGVALVPGALVGSEPISFEGGPRRGTITLKCRTGRPYLDAIRMIDGNGRILKRISLIDALHNSPFVHLLQSTLGPDGRREAFCDPLHQLRSPAWRRRWRDVGPRAGRPRGVPAEPKRIRHSRWRIGARQAAGPREFPLSTQRPSPNGIDLPDVRQSRR